jgi:hypothetical protein
MNMHEVGGTTADGRGQSWTDGHGCDGRNPCHARYTHPLHDATLVPPGHVGYDNVDFSRSGLPRCQITQVSLHATVVRRVKLANVQNRNLLHEPLTPYRASMPNQ